MNTRRDFIKLTGAGLLAAGAVPVFGKEAVSEAAQAVPGKKKADLFNIGMAGYTFAQVPIEKAIEIMKRVNVLNLSLKDVYLPMNSTGNDKISYRKIQIGRNYCLYCWCCLYEKRAGSRSGV